MSWTLYAPRSLIGQQPPTLQLWAALIAGAADVPAPIEVAQGHVAVALSSRSYAGRVGIGHAKLAEAVSALVAVQLLAKTADGVGPRPATYCVPVEAPELTAMPTAVLARIIAQAGARAAQAAMHLEHRRERSGLVLMPVVGLARRMGVSEDTAQRAMAALRAHGFIRLHRAARFTRDHAAWHACAWVARPHRKSSAQRPRQSSAAQGYRARKAVPYHYYVVKGRRSPRTLPALTSSSALQPFTPTFDWATGTWLPGHDPFEPSPMLEHEPGQPAVLSMMGAAP